MPQIRILPVELRNKIAAGEVVERPASVVKELLENAIDAGSTGITVEVLRGGKGLIKVIDNGSGMDSDDAHLALQPHATSKLTTEQDLFNIGTLGFRGEALPSIASVSRMKLETGLRGALSGVSIEIAGGQIKQPRDCPAAGTSVEIRDLFFNTPARKKFLKSDSTELFHIIDTVTREALSRWDIGFRLFTETRETMNLPVASGPRERILQIYGQDFLEELTEVTARDRMFGMTAFVTKGDSFRNSKAHQFIFVNRRPIKDQAITHAVYDAYKGILPQDRHPVFFLFLEADPGKVDFNVHPTKREVRFENKQEIHVFVSGHIREAVRKEHSRYTAPFMEAPGWAVSEMPSPFGKSEPPGPFSSGIGTPLPPENAPYEAMEFPYQQQLPYLYLGDTFIAVAGKGGLTLIDHHAAHERILFESFLKGIDLDSSALLFPRQVKLSPKEYEVILREKDLLLAMGMEIDDFGHNTLIVRSLPAALKEADVRGILADVAAALIEGARPFQSTREVLAARIACHSSVRGRAILHREEFQKLLHRLEKTEHPDQCPHGRPTRIFLSLDDLQKLFKRK
jgi:DNA mismatch repair protein MutL